MHETNTENALAHVNIARRMEVIKRSTDASVRMKRSHFLKIVCYTFRHDWTFAARHHIFKRLVIQILLFVLFVSDINLLRFATPILGEGNSSSAVTAGR